MDSIELWLQSRAKADSIKKKGHPELALDALRKLPGSLRTIPGAKHRPATRQMTLVAQGTS
jgi:hypothetical protein